MCILKFSANILAIKFQINFDSSEDFNNIWRPYVLGNKNFLLFSFSFLLLLLPSPSSSYSVGRMSMKSSRPCSVGDLRDTQKTSIFFWSGFLIHVTVPARFRFVYSSGWCSSPHPLPWTCCFSFSETYHYVTKFLWHPAQRNWICWAHAYKKDVDFHPTKHSNTLGNQHLFLFPRKIRDRYTKYHFSAPPHLLPGGRGLRVHILE